MLHDTGQGRLTAILMADAVGYSRGMSGNERETLSALVESRNVMAEVVASLGGRVVGTQGDSFLAEFPSSTNAVLAALRIQSALAASRENAEGHSLAYRVGVNLGDVYDVDGDIHGDGVNIAARLQTLAEPGGVLVSGAVYDLARDRVDADFAFAGEHSLKNISGKVRAYRLTSKAAGHARGRPRPQAPEYERPAVEIQRFRVLAGGRAARKACDMIAEELTSMLSSIAGILLIRGDLAPHAEEAPPPRSPHHYRLTGTGVAGDGRFRLSVQLV